MTNSRRKFLAMAAASPLVLLAGSDALAQAAPACFDPESLPFSQKSRRRSVGYTEPSTDPAKHCGLCAFFTASRIGCGTCTILGAGPVSATAVCSSFAAKSG